MCQGVEAAFNVLNRFNLIWYRAYNILFIRWIYGILSNWVERERETPCINDKVAFLTIGHEYQNVCISFIQSWSGHMYNRNHYSRFYTQNSQSLSREIFQFTFVPNQQTNTQIPITFRIHCVFNQYNICTVLLSIFFPAYGWNVVKKPYMFDLTPSIEVVACIMCAAMTFSDGETMKYWHDVSNDQWE